MLNLPIYFLGSSYYLHTRIAGKQVKRSLRTSFKREAIIRAIALLNSLRMSTPQKYELDLASGVMKADGPEDHSRLMQAMEAMKALHSGKGTVPAHAVASTVAAPSHDDPTALKLGELLEKFFLLRNVAQATALSYKNAADEFSTFLKNPPITRITTSDVTRWQEHLAKKGNVPRTIDGKVGVIKAIYNFAKKQGYTARTILPLIVICSRRNRSSGAAMRRLKPMKSRSCWAAIFSGSASPKTQTTQQRFSWA